MSETVPAFWSELSLSELLVSDSFFCDGDWVESRDQDVEGTNRLIQLADIGDGRFLDKSNRFMNDAQFARLRCTALSQGDILIARMPDPIGRACIFPAMNMRCATVVDVAILRNAKADPLWLVAAINSDSFRRSIEINSCGTTRTRISRSFLSGLRLIVPPLETQKSIAKIIGRIDTVIEKTEALIDKYQQIQTGLMHDLFTRGVLPNGQLRPSHDEAPEMYQRAAIGWIPKEWKLKDASMVLESVADGPFGSNLKTEHYVVDPGVRVVRLQNVVKHEYNDGDKAYVSDRHAAFLVRNKVVGGDVLIAGLGEDRYPVGRACTYPEYLPPAINKADCFRARCVSGVMQNKFFMLFLNSELARRQIRRYEQGVTRPRINTGNLKRLIVGVPSINEQIAIIERFEAAQANIHRQQASVENLKAQKLGLMQDLLTGKVPVMINAPETADA
ncbi:hypothetical protein PflCFBP13510_13440 [Pseudomonas fluorescens]|nr:hypothetical protein PflCFBP13510_13440 [Pseudomonas fluorescens]